MERYNFLFCIDENNNIVYVNFRRYVNDNNIIQHITRVFKKVTPNKSLRFVTRKAINQIRNNNECYCYYGEVIKGKTLNTYFGEYKIDTQKV